ncbi:MAG: hypothetical protein AAGD22_07175 [Verrucomicrobiota bacterium]
MSSTSLKTIVAIASVLFFGCSEKQEQFESVARLVVSPSRPPDKEVVDWVEGLPGMVASPDFLQRTKTQLSESKPDLIPSKVELVVVRKSSTVLIRAIGYSPEYTQAFLGAALDEIILADRKQAGWSLEQEEEIDGLAQSLLALEKELVALEKQFSEDSDSEVLSQLEEKRSALRMDYESRLKQLRKADVSRSLMKYRLTVMEPPSRPMLRRL